MLSVIPVSKIGRSVIAGSSRRLRRKSDEVGKEVRHVYIRSSVGCCVMIQEVTRLSVRSRIRRSDVVLGDDLV